MSRHTTDDTAHPICFVDVETDGLSPHCRAWEVAVIRRDPATGLDVEHQWLLPLDLRHADPRALDVGRFWDRHPVGRKVSGKEPCPTDTATTPKHDVARDVMRLTYGATLVGASVHFDADVLARLLRNEGYLPSWSHRLRCVTTLASGLAGRDIGGLDSAAETWLVNVPEQDRHTAMGDARTARNVYDAVMSIGRRTGLDAQSVTFPRHSTSEHSTAGGRS